MQKPSGVLKENSLETKLMTVDIAHAGNDDGQHKCHNGNQDLQAAVTVEETEWIHNYLEWVARVKMPMISKVRTAR